MTFISYFVGNVFSNFRVWTAASKNSSSSSGNKIGVTPDILLMFRKRNVLYIRLFGIPLSKERDFITHLKKYCFPVGA